MWLDGTTGEAWLERRDEGLQKTLSNVHQLQGPEGGVAHVLWALWVDVTGVAVVAFAATGVLLWAWTRADRLGAGLLAASTLSCAAAIASLLFGR